MNRDELRAIIFSKIDELPTLPDVVPKVLDVMEGSRSNAYGVTEVISRDSAMTSKILRVANSAYYGFPQEISDLERAVALVGFNMVKSLAVSMGVMQCLTSGRRSPHFSMEGLWVHSLAVATVMRELGRRYPQASGGQHLFVIGLLHDIGKVVLAQFFGDLFEEVLGTVEQMEPARLHVAERKVIGFDHGEVGAILLKRWMFPDIITGPIACHHQTETPQDTNAIDLAMLRISDTLPQSLGLGDKGNPDVAEVQDADLMAIAMKREDLASLRSFLDAATDGIHAFFGAMR